MLGCRAAVGLCHASAASTAPLHHQAPPMAILPGICSALERDTAEKMPEAFFLLSAMPAHKANLHTRMCISHSRFAPALILINPGLFSQALMVFRGDWTRVGENSLQIRVPPAL